MKHRTDVIPDLIQYPVICGFPPSQGMTLLRYFVAGVISMVQVSFGEYEFRLLCSCSLLLRGLPCGLRLFSYRFPMPEACSLRPSAAPVTLLSKHFPLTVEEISEH
jgi:hypothetical protein